MFIFFPKVEKWEMWTFQMQYQTFVLQKLLLLVNTNTMGAVLDIQVLTLTLVRLDHSYLNLILYKLIRAHFWLR